MTVYGPDHAALYDLFHQDKNYAAEARFVDELVRRKGVGDRPTLLDAACGTGRHAEQFVGLGYDVTGVDQSGAMVERARERCPGARFEVGDLAEVDLGGLFDVVTCLFDSLGYLVTNERICQGLRNLGSHLAPDGLLIAEVWHAPAMLRNFEPVRHREWSLGGARVSRVSTTAIDVATQTGCVRYRTLQIGASRVVSDWTEEHVNRFFGLQEVAALLTSAGLELCASFGGFSAEAPVDIDAWHLVISASRSC